MPPIRSSDLNSLEGVIFGIKKGTTTKVIEGDTKGLEYSSCGIERTLGLVCSV